MSLVTIEVDIDHGRIFPRGSEPLPEKSAALLTLLPNPPEAVRRGSVSEFIATWAGAFAPVRSQKDGARLTYLLEKRVK